MRKKGTTSYVPGIPDRAQERVLNWLRARKVYTRFWSAFVSGRLILSSGPRARSIARSEGEIGVFVPGVRYQLNEKGASVERIVIFPDVWVGASRRILFININTRARRHLQLELRTLPLCSTSAQRSTQLPLLPPRRTPRMRSETSKTKYSTCTKSKTVMTGPTIPQDIINEIADHLVIDSDFRSIRACALLSESSLQPCRRHLFRIVVFTPTNVDRWFKMFPSPEESPAHLVKDLRICIGGGVCVPDKFFKYTQWFINAEKISLLGRGGFPLMGRTSLWRFPPSATSLTIDTGVITLLQVRDIMAQLPNLDDLSLSGSLVAMDRRELLGIGAVLRGSFGGRLILSDEYADEDVINMLLEIPSGLRFTEVQVHSTSKRLPLAVSLVEACGKTLAKLSYTIPSHGKLYPFSLFGPRNTNAYAVPRSRWSRDA